MARLHVGAASDPGLQRSINEDRVWCDEARGIFLVVDGLGGHAAGETAAATAVDVIRQQLNPALATDLEAHIRAVVCAANNEIYRLADGNPEWHGMACVLTLAAMQDDHVMVGHVGDSRLYRFWNGKLTKVTHDHSPVGEQEEQGLLTEEEAMQHPRRNEIYRDVGSVPRFSDEPDYVEIQHFLFRNDAALLLCSDGLSDCVNAAEMSAIIERYDGDAERISQMLVEAANAAGGKDNISTIFIAGPDFRGADAKRWNDARARHAMTRQRSESSSSGFPGWLKALLIVLVCAGLGYGAWLWIEKMTAVPAAVKAPAGTPRVIQVDATNARGIMDALNTAVAGDTISVPPGDYLGPLVLKDRVNVVAKVAGEAVIRSDAAAAAEQGNGIVARNLKSGLVRGLKVTADDTHPLKTGVLVVDSAVDLEYLDVSGAVYSGIRIEGDSKPRLIENFIHNNGGAGVAISDKAAPVLVRNQIMQNGLTVNAPKPGIETGPMARPELEGNLVSGNGTDEPLRTGHAAELAKHGGKR